MSDERVWISSIRGKGAKSRVYHTDPDCAHIKQMVRPPRQVDPAVLFDETEECEYCAGTVDPRSFTGSFDSFAWRNKRPPDPMEWTTCLVCGADKDAGEPCKWCTKFDAINDLDPRVDLAHLYALAGACENGQGEVAVRP